MDVVVLLELVAMHESSGFSLTYICRPSMFLVIRFVTYALLSGAEYADLTLKAFSIWLMSNGALCSLSPNQADDAWGGEAEDTTAGGRAKIRVIGGNCLALGTFCHALAMDKSPAQALGLAFIPIVINLVNCMYVSPADFMDAGVKEGPVYGWIAALLVGIATLAFPEAAAAAAE